MDYDDGVSGGGHDAAIRDGDFENTTSTEDAASFDQMPNWTNLASGEDQTLEMTRANLDSGVGGTRNFVVNTDRNPAQSLGQTITTGDTFNASFMWRDASGWDDTTGRISLVLYYTDNDQINGTATDLVTFTSRASTTNSAYQTETFTSTGFSDSGADGKNLFLRIETESDGYARMDNIYIEVASVPEPSSSALLGLGGLALLLRRRR